MNKKLLFFGIVFMLLVVAMVSAKDICIDTEAPSAPTNLGITDSPYDADGSVTLSWTAASDTPACSGIDHYNIYRSTDGTVFTKIGESTTTSFTDSGLSQGTTYYYKVTAVDKVLINPNEGSASGTASTTIGTAPSGGGGGSTGGGGGSGGGGGGSGSTTDDSKNWNCGDWTDCINGEQTRECEHKTRSGVTKTDTQSCNDTTSTGGTNTQGTAGAQGSQVTEEDKGTGGTEEDTKEGKTDLGAGDKQDLGPTGAAVGAGAFTSIWFFIILLIIIVALFLLVILSKYGGHAALFALLFILSLAALALFAIFKPLGKFSWMLFALLLALVIALLLLFLFKKNKKKKKKRRNGKRKRR